MKAASVAAAWHPDPRRQHRVRYWDGQGWTTWVADAGGAFNDADPAHDELAHIAYLQRFLADAAVRGLLDPSSARDLLQLAEQRRVAALAPPPPDEPFRVAARPTVSAHPSAPGPRVVWTPPQRPPAPVERHTGALRQAWDRWRTVVAGDLAIHGLAYLGVLLLFAGIFGLVVFAFGDVSVSWRPVAESAAPAATFGAAFFLRRRGAPFVGTALQAVGAAVLAVVFIASMSDGSDLPPDLGGLRLVAVLTVGCLVIAGAYAVAARDEQSPLRFAVAPMVWLAVAMAALGLEDRVPTGRDLATPRPVQAAIVSVSIVMTVALARLIFRQERRREVEVPALVAFGIVGVLALLAATEGGWPAVSIAVTALAGAVLAELLFDRLGPDVTGALQALFVGIAVASLHPAVGTGVTAGLGVLAGLGLVEWIGWRHPAAIGAGIAGAGAGVALASSLARPGWAVAAGLAAWTWVLARRTWRAPWSRPVPDLLWTAGAALLPAIPAIGLFRLVAVDAALLLIAEVVAAAGLTARVVATDDRLWRWWPHTVLVGIALATASAAADPSGASVLAVVVVAAGLAVAPGSLAIAIWSSAGAVVWATVLAGAYAGTAPTTTALVLAIAAFIALASATTGSAGAHLGLMAHAVALGTVLFAPVGDWWAVAVEVLFAAGWALTLVRQERGHSLPLRLAAEALTAAGDHRADRWIDWVPASMVTASLPLVVHGGVTAADVQPSWWGLPFATAGAAACLVARLVRSRARTSTVLTIGGLALSVAAVLLLGGEATPAAATLTVALAACGLAPTAGWPPIVPWWSSIVFAAWTVAVPVHFGMDPELWFTVLLGWGPVVAIGALAVDTRRYGRRETGQVVRAPSLLAPLTVASLATVTGLAEAYTHAPSVYGTCSFVVAAAIAVVAVQLRAGVLTVATYALIGVGFDAALPLAALEVPWTIVAFSGALVGWRVVLARVTESRSPWARWDSAPIPVAAAALLVALAAAAANGYVPATYLGAAAVVALVALAEAEPWWLTGSVGLALVGAGALGPGWLALGLASTSVAATAAAARSRAEVRDALQAVAVGAACSAWAAGLDWQEMATRDAVVSTTVVGGGVALGLGVAVRWLRLPVGWAAVWAAAPVLGVGTSLAVALSTTGSVHDDGLVAAGIALSGSAVGAGVAAAPAQAEWLRLTSVGLLAGGLAAFAAGTHLGAEPVAWMSLATGLACTAVALAAIVTRPASPWLPAWLAMGAVAASAAIVTAIAGDLAPGLLGLALLAAAAEAAAVGTATRSTALLTASPVLAAVAWVVVARDALAARPIWFGVPVGLALLVDTGLIRWRRRADGEEVATPSLIALDDVGMAFVVGTPLLEAVAGGPLEAVVTAAIGALVTIWGVQTRVRRRVIVGAVGVVAGVLVLLVLPLVPLVPQPSGPVLWVALAASGVAIIAAAAGLEHGRATLRHGIEHLESLMRGWE